MNYTQFTFTLLDANDSSILIALLQLFEVESIWEEDKIVHAYFHDDKISVYEGDFNQALKAKVDFLISDIKESTPAVINWNKEWESNFPIVEVDQFAFIYADFHDRKSGFEHYIKIAPKMAFGTGHHETTFMMIQSMKDIDHRNNNVLDLGCGTGILSVLASKLGATEIDAIDIEEPSFENTKEHAVLNGVEINAMLGGVEDVLDKDYDIVLANINRNVLLTYTAEIQSFISSGGDLLLSGILKEDRALIEKAYDDLALKGIKAKGNWLCFHYSKGK